MKQYQINGNKLILRVKKASLLARSMMFFFAFLFFLMPLTGMIIHMASGNGFHIGFLFGLIFFGLMGFYLLRVALWNTYGNEKITFDKTKLTYIADYGWFKDGKKKIERNNSFEFSIKKIGYEDDNKGGLVIGLSEPQILCVTKMPIGELEELVEELGNADNNK